MMQLLDELETLVSSSSRIPFTSNIIINEEDLLDILDQMRVSVPQEIKEARRTEAERERIISRAKEEAGRLVSLSKEKMLAATDDHEIVVSARDRAKEILLDAEQESADMKVDAHHYVAENLSTLEENLLKLLTTVRNGIRQVERMKPEVPTREDINLPEETAPEGTPDSAA